MFYIYNSYFSHIISDSIANYRSTKMDFNLMNSHSLFLIIFNCDSFPYQQLKNTWNSMLPKYRINERNPTLRIFFCEENLVQYIRAVSRQALQIRWSATCDPFFDNLLSAICYIKKLIIISEEFVMSIELKELIVKIIIKILVYVTLDIWKILMYRVTMLKMNKIATQITIISCARSCTYKWCLTHSQIIAPLLELSRYCSAWSLKIFVRR